MSSAQNPARLGAVGHASQGAAQGVVPCRPLHDVSPTVLAHDDDVAQDWTFTRQLPTSCLMQVL